MERLTAGSMDIARKCLLMMRKITIPPPDSGDPPDGHEKNISPRLLGPTNYIFARKEVPDSRDPPGQSVCSIVILVVNVYVHI